MGEFYLLSPLRRLDKCFYLPWEVMGIYDYSIEIERRIIIEKSFQPIVEERLTADRYQTFGNCLRDGP